ncbi:uncharacterized protein N7477_009873 [Penicillium maclennaniae]|uniref:uncharacterized protein n=1 Tax=Penicillium maclennaniae TaxID=1343394 RepID=UPI0025422DF0|nr:uncharacterized protein N7477_009873 [Penicillium maclennaniae]KAJ5662257.1 hypothetical protein N7477_009873 [Penicillium maclennaniae]
MSLSDVQYFDTSVAGFLDSTDGLLGLSPLVDETTWLDTISPGSVYQFGQDFDNDRLSLSPDDRYGLMISSSLADELIHIYFDKVQAFCPLFLRTKFDQDLSWNHMANRDQRHPGLSPVYQFILNGMFALSARFSNAPEFIGIDPTCRGQIFVKRATKLWEWISRDFKHCLRTLQCLQGLILLTFSSLLSGPSEDAWIQSGTCVRLAYDLDLHTTDAHKQTLRASSPLQQNQEAWVLLEERRRAWWMVWEIDTFSSAVSLRPFAIDSRFIHVLLPVSDDDWNNKAQAPSALLNANGGMPWKHLAESSNRSERAWFLVCLAVFRQACDAAVPPGPSVQMLHHAEAAIGCAFLALPPSFQDFSMSAASCHTSYVTLNWIACSLIVLNWYALCPVSSSTIFTLVWHG